MSIGILMLNSKRLAARLAPLQEIVECFASAELRKQIIMGWRANGALSDDEAGLLITAYMLEDA